MLIFFQKIENENLVHKLCENLKKVSHKVLNILTNIKGKKKFWFGKTLTDPLSAIDPNVCSVFQNTKYYQPSNSNQNLEI